MSYRIEIGGRALFYFWSYPVINQLKANIPDTKDILIGEEETKKVVGNGRLVSILENMKKSHGIRKPLREALIELEGIVNEAVKSGNDLAVSNYMVLNSNC